jgi:hypothetical protein
MAHQSAAPPTQRLQRNQPLFVSLHNNVIIIMNDDDDLPRQTQDKTQGDKGSFAKFRRLLVCTVERQRIASALRHCIVRPAALHKTPSFSAFSHVCPEPVLVKCSFLV